MEWGGQQPPQFPPPRQVSFPARHGGRPPGVLIAVIAVVVLTVVPLGVVFSVHWSTSYAQRQRAFAAPWQAVASPKTGLTYDVPRDWQVESPDMIVGYEQPDPKAPFGYKPYIAGYGASRVPGECDPKSSHRAQAVILPAGTVGPEVAAPRAAAVWLQGAAMDKEGKFTKVDPDPVTRLRFGNGTAASSSASADIPDGRQSGLCSTTTVDVVSVAVSVGGKTRVLIVEAERAGTMADRIIMTKIAASLRPLH